MQTKKQFNKKDNKPYFNNKNKPYFNNKNKPYFNKKNKPYFNNKNKNSFYYYKKKNNIYYILGEKRPKRPLTTTYLHRNKKIKIGMFFKKPSYKQILYPFHLNLKLINEYLRKN